jgi:hypothetical protein
VLGVTPPNLKRMENGKRRMSEGMWGLLAEHGYLPQGDVQLPPAAGG